MLKYNFLKTFWVLALGIWATSAQAQVRGVVTDASTREAIPNVVVEHTESGTKVSTNVNGQFDINAQVGSDLKFTHFQYMTKSAKASANMTVSLEPQISELDEAVVVGYGVQKKSNVTGAISSVSSKDLKDMALPRVENALQGRTSGVMVTQASGQPGAGAVVRIRGTATINGADPLYVVDGVIIGGGIDFLNPSDIESIEVLKDAASAAIYGARAANGVIIVTTKKGRVNENMEVAVNSYTGVQSPWKKVGVLNAQEYATLQNEMAAASGATIKFEDPASLGEGTDWQDAVFNYNAPIKTTDVSITGGHSAGSYYASVSQFSQEGIVAPGASNFDRFSARLNTVTYVNDRLTVGWNAAYTRAESRGVGDNTEWGSPLGRALNMDPITPVYETDPLKLSQSPYSVNGVLRHNLVYGDGGIYGISPYVTSEIVNPVAGYSILNNDGWSDKFVNSTYAELELAENLKFRSSIGVDLAYWGGTQFSAPYYLNATNYLDTNRISVNFNRGFTWIWDNSISYAWESGAHNFDVIAGHSAQEVNGTYLSGSKMDVPTQNPEDATIDYARNELSEAVSGGKWERYALESYFSRLNWSYDNRFMATAIMRADASVRFGPNYRWGYFPSLSGGWNLHNEDFWNADGPIQRLKLRAGWGLNGNDAAGSLEYASTIAGGRSYTFGYNEVITNGTTPAQISNPDLRWESVSQGNFGVDMDIFKYFNASIDLFYRKTYGMKVRPTLPDYVGNDAPTANVGEMVNQGVDFEFGYRRSYTQDLYVSSMANISFVQNTVVELGNEAGFLTGAGWGPQGLQVTRTTEGLPVGYLFGYRTDGVFQNQAEVAAYANGEGELFQPDAVAGDLKFVDVNGDGVIDEDDRTIIGNPTPDFTFGWMQQVDYKQWDFSCFFQGVYGNEIFNATRRYDLPTSNMPTWTLDRWTGDGSSYDVPRLTLDDANRNFARSSDFYVEDGSFLRLKNLQLGYNLEGDWLRRVGMSRMRFYYSGNNLLTFTNYSGFDPEIGAGLGVDRGIYPQARTHSFGINVSFK